MGSRRPLPYDFDLVTRRINQRLSSLRLVLGGVPTGSGHLRIDRPFNAIGDEKIPSWHTTGRLYGSGMRVARYTRVDIELTAWSQHATELRLRPVTRRVSAWGQRRQRRFFQLAHRSADDLVRSLDAAVRRHDALTTLHRSTTDHRTVKEAEPCRPSVDRT